MKLLRGSSIAILITASFLAGCEKDEFPNVKVDKDLILELKSKFVSTVTINSHSYSIDAYLWRDFMPISPPNGKPLISINWLISADSSAIPDNIVMTHQYIIYGDSVWIANYEDEAPPPSTPDYKIEKISRNGPKWGPFVYVDVIAKISNTKTNQDYYLKREKVLILRTD